MLQRLDTSYLDLLLIHWPATSGLRLSSPQHRQNRAATWQAMQGLYQQQRCRFCPVARDTALLCADMELRLQLGATWQTVQEMLIHQQHK